MATPGNGRALRPSRLAGQAFDAATNVAAHVLHAANGTNMVLRGENKFGVGKNGLEQEKEDPTQNEQLFEEHWTTFPEFRTV